MSELKKKADNDAFIRQLGNAPKPTLLEAIEELWSPIPDTWVYRLAVGTLGLVILIGIVGAIFLANGGTEIPDVLVALSSAAVGAIGDLLAPKPG